MNHQKIYNSIIEKAISENRKKESGISYENHHIIPKCVGGNNTKENLVLLTFREHFVCHKLLIYIYAGNNKIRFGFYMMATSKKKQSMYKVSSREYMDAKNQMKLYLRSDEVKEKRKENTFKRNFSGPKFEKYLESLKDCRYSPSDGSIINVNKTSFESNNENLQNKVQRGNEKGCYVKINKG